MEVLFSDDLPMKALKHNLTINPDALARAVIAHARTPEYASHTISIAM